MDGEKIKTMSAFDSISVDDIQLTKLDRYVSDLFFALHVIYFD